MSVAVSKSKFREVVPRDESEKHGGSYSMCLHLCVLFFADWLNQHDQDTPVAYFFESGHADQAEANALMAKITHPWYADVKKRFHYTAHAFADKKAMSMLQSADLLAWQHQKHLKDGRSVNTARGDFRALMDRVHILHLMDERSLRRMVDNTRDFYGKKRTLFEALNANAQRLREAGGDFTKAD
jgi:hypothetical protein